jgi:outer membrane protein assembly factor BamB
MRDSVVSINPDTDSLSEQWQTDCRFGYDINSAMISDLAGVVWYGTKNGMILALDSSTGRRCGRVRFGTTPINTITPVNRHEAVITTFDGVVARIFVPF